MPTRLLPWPGGEQSRPLAGISSFGFGGSNCHVVVQGLTPDAAEDGTDDALAVQGQGWMLLPVSARDVGALEARQRQVAAAWEGAGDTRAARDLAHTLAARRAHLEHRAAYVARTGEPLVEPLQGSWRRGDEHRVALVFSGHGSQWPRMGADLLRASRPYRQAFAEVAAALEPYLGWCPLTALDRDELGARLTTVSQVQPLIFAVQVALTSLWRSAGVVPDAVVGHSVGEVAAAYTAGILDLEDAARVVCGRSRVLERVSGRGIMMAVPLPLEEATRAVAGREARVSVAVINGGPYSVLAGEPADLEALSRELADRGVEARRVDIDVAAHSPQIDALMPAMRASAAGIRPRVPTVPMASTVSGELVRGATLDPDYWADNLRRPVRFDLAVSRLLADGVDTFVEVSPHPLMLGAIEWLSGQAGRHALGVGSLRRNQPGAGGRGRAPKPLPPEPRGVVR